MALWTTLGLLCMASCFAAENLPAKQRTICDEDYNATSKIQCMCEKNHDKQVIESADCYVTSDNIYPDDKSWDQFCLLKTITQLTLSNVRGKSLKFIPIRGLQNTALITKIDVKYNDIPRIESYAFANLTELKEIHIKDNKINTLAVKAFAHLPSLTKIFLDKNNIAEINRDVFVDLPKLQKLYLTTNMITTIHDRAFVNLVNLKLLEIDNNGLFSLNNETFSGLRNLEVLDLSGNSLEVIGDNTFLPLKNLRSLNLEGNKLQMLDDKAFDGLAKLHSLRLANNLLAYIENVQIFEPLKGLTSLSLRENKLQELKAGVISPILSNFYGANSSLDVEANNFPCDCRLEWLMVLMNKTKNKNLKLALENLKCTPDAKTKDLYTKTAEKEKSQVLEEEQIANGDYEYYDDTQLDGKLFYTDLRILLNCTTAPAKESSHDNKRQAGQRVNMILNNELDHARKEMMTEDSKTKINEADPTEVSVNKAHYTTSRLATVSAKPIAEKKSYDEREMAADEAKPDALPHSHVENLTGSGQRNSCAIFVTAAILFRLLF